MCMENLESMITKIIASHDAGLYDIQTIKEHEDTIYRILVTKQGGVSIDLCVDISNELSPLLDVHPPMAGTYRLEVSSPGIERKLSKSSHYLHAIGERVKVKIQGGEKYQGTLESIDERSITVETKEGEMQFNFEEMGTVKTYFEWNK